MSDKEVKFVLTAQDRTLSAINGLRSNLGGLQSKATEANVAMGKLGAVFGPAFAGATLTAFIKGTTDSIDRLNDLRDATGASIENISALEDVGARTGTSFDTVSTSLIKFNKVLSDAKPGSDTAQILKSLGLDAAALRKEDPAEALRKTAVALSGYADDGEKARVVQELFGKSVRDVAPFLADLAGKTELVGTVTTEQAKAAEKFNQQLFDLQKNATDAARSITSALLPGLNNLFEAYNKFGGLPGVVKAIFGLDDLSKREATVSALQEQIGRTTDAVDRMSEALRRDPGNDFLAVRIDKAKARLADLQKQLVATNEQLKADANALAPLSIANVPKPSLPSAPPPPPKAKAAARPPKEEIDASQRALAAYVQTLAREGEKLNELSDEQKALNFLKTLGTAGQIPQVRELVLGLAAQNDELADQAALRKLNLEAEQAINEQREKAAATLAEFTAGGAAVTASVREETAQIGLNANELRRRSELQKIDALLARASAAATSEQRAEYERLARVMREDLVNALEAAEAAQVRFRDSFGAGASKALEEYLAAASDNFSQGERLFNDTVSNMEDALTAFVATGKLNFRQLANSIIADIARIQARKLIAGLIENVFGADWSGGSAANAGSASFNTGALTNPTGTRATGGSVLAGETYLVGENGPELLKMGNMSGNVAPGAGGAAALNVTFGPVTIDARGADAGAEQRFRTALAAQQQDTLNKVYQSMRRGGALAG